MPTRAVQTVTIDTGAGGQTLNYNLDQLDLSNADWMRLTLTLTKIDTDAGDTCDVYVQSRGKDGNWMDRAHFPQVLGTGSPTEIWTQVLQQGATLSSTEESMEPSGSSGGARLAAGEVLHGPFPGLYRDSTGWGPSWRVQVVVADSDNDGDFEGSVIFEVSGVY